jgi:transposase
MKISEIAKILQVHKSTGGLTNSREREEKCLFHKERKGRKKKVNEREIKVEEIQGKTIWEANIEEKFNVKISYVTAWVLEPRLVKLKSKLQCFILLMYKSCHELKIIYTLYNLY